MIAAIALGGLLGAAVFLVVLRLSPPKTSPLVQLAQLDAQHAPGITAVSRWRYLVRSR